MADAVVDEAIRNVVAVGGDPDQVRPARQLLVGRSAAPDDARRARRRRARAATTRRSRTARPFVSGKDSLNNEYTGADGQRHAVPPTLVITAVAHVPDVGRCVTAELTAAGNALFLLGRHGAGVRRQPPRPRARRAGRSPAPRRSPIPTRPARYRRLHAAIRDDLVRACHDVSEGGLAVALAELCIAGRLGRDDRRAPPRRRGDRAVRRVDRPPRRRGRARPTSSASSPSATPPIGTVTAEPAARPAWPIPVADLAAAFRRGDVTRRHPPSLRVRMRAGRSVPDGPILGWTTGRAAGRHRRRRAGDEPRHRRRAGARPRRCRAVGRARRRADGPTRAARRRPHRRRRRRLQLRRRPRRRSHAGPRPHRRRRRPPRRAPARVRRRRPARSSASATASRC